MSHFSPSQKSTCLLFESSGGETIRKVMGEEKEEWFYFCESNPYYGDLSIVTLELGGKANHMICNWI